METFFYAQNEGFEQKGRRLLQPSNITKRSPDKRYTQELLHNKKALPNKQQGFKKIKQEYYNF